MHYWGTVEQLLHENDDSDQLGDDAAVPVEAAALDHVDYMAMHSDS